ncbi:ribosomal protein L27, partial [Aureobasidium melanogenum]
MAATDPLHHKPNLRWDALTPTIITTTLATAVVILRLVVRCKFVKAVGFDDFVIMVSLFLSWVVLGLTVAMVVSGFGSYVWSNPLDLHSTTAKLYLSWNVLYVFLIHVTKASILTQYLRIFPTRTMRRLTWLLFAALVPSVLWGVFASIFICNPVRKVWRPMTPGKCLSTRTYWVSVTAVNIVLDFAVLALPMPVISRLKLPKKQKIGLVGVFLLGFFTCAVSVVRLVLVHNAYVRHDFTASSAEAVTWSMVEANVGIICASLLALKPLMAYLFPQRTKERQPPRWSLTLNTVPTAETTEPDPEKGRVEEEEPVVPRTMSSTDRLEKIQEELEDSDELTLVAKQRNHTHRSTMLLPRIRALPTGSSPAISTLETALSALRLSSCTTTSITSIAVRHASHKAQGAANSAKDGPGKRLGAKKSGEQYVIPGNIIFRQRGTKWFPGDNCAMGRDHTIYATQPGYVKYYKDPLKHPKRQYIGVVFERSQVLPQPPHAVRRRRLGMLAYQMETPHLEAQLQGDLVTGAETGLGGNAGMGAGHPSTIREAPKENRGKVVVKDKITGEVVRATPTLRPGYQYRAANWEIGRAAERAGIRVTPFKPGNRFLAWRKAAARKARNAERRGLTRRR